MLASQNALELSQSLLSLPQSDDYSKLVKELMKAGNGKVDPENPELCPVLKVDGNSVTMHSQTK